MYLLDTDACLDFLLARRPAVGERVRQAFGRLNVSMISVAELRVGIRTSSDAAGDARRLNIFLTLVTPHAFDAAAATAYGAVARHVGVGRQDVDRLIAAHAIALGLTLVTGHRSDFVGVPGLVMEDWR